MKKRRNVFCYEYIVQENMDKIKETVYLLTCSEAINYGTMLQVYASQCVLLEFFADVRIIDYRRFTKPGIPEYSPKLVKSFKSKVSFTLFYFHRKNKAKAFEEFRKNINYTDKIFWRDSKRELVKFLKRCKYICIGSDQVWNPSIQDSDIFTLSDCESDNIKFSFSSSMGNAYEKADHLKKLERGLSSFHVLSVREEKTKFFLECLLDKKVKLVIDPTLILNKHEWRKMENPINIGNRFILVYLAQYSSNLLKKAFIRAKEYNCNLMVLSDIYIPSLSTRMINLSSISPETFLFLIDNAFEVYTNSYHGLVFSINFNKNFIVEEPIKDDDRINTVLSMYKLEDRKLNGLNNAKQTTIDYSEVNSILEEKRKEVRDFLGAINDF